MKTQLALLILLFCFESVYSQTAADIEKKFGKREDVYSVSEHIWMTPEYAADGQVCQMRLYAKRVAPNINYVGGTLQFEELRDVLNSLVPPETRGLKQKLNFGTSATGGPAVWTTYPYERVSFTFVASFQKPADGTLLRRGEFVFSIPPGDYKPKEENPVPSKDDFVRDQVFKTEIVTIRWNDRKCSGQSSGDLGARQLEDVQINAQSINSFFSEFAFFHDVPVGLEIARTDNPHTRYYIDFKKGTVAELLTQFVAQHPEYAWKIEDGVVNVFPKDGYRDVITRDLLATRIQRFSIGKGLSCWDLVRMLFAQSEAKAILKARRLNYQTYGPGGFYIQNVGQNFTLDVSDVTLQSILNKVVNKSPTSKFWIIMRQEDRTVFLGVRATAENSIKLTRKQLNELF